ncbi:MAG: hypothetical protein LBR79_03830, partial [Oscillospiraceae bacterium]|nr:hypothetical protein [Oscillospiraceae bacterium]
LNPEGKSGPQAKNLLGHMMQFCILQPVYPKDGRAIRAGPSWILGGAWSGCRGLRPRWRAGRSIRLARRLADRRKINRQKPPIFSIADFNMS